MAVRCLCAWPVERGIHPDDFEHHHSALRAAARRGNVDMVRHLCDLLLARGMDLGARSGVILQIAADCLPVLQYLCELPVDLGIDPGVRDNKVLRVAAQFGRVDIVQFLCELPVERGVDPGACGNLPIQLAAAYGHLPVVQYLCELPRERGVRPGAKRGRALFLAAAKGHLHEVRYLFVWLRERGLLVPNGALRKASEKGHDAVVEYLREAIQAHRNTAVATSCAS